MSAEILFENFDLLAEAPNGVQNLRELILQLSVSGRLLPQRSDEGSALELIRLMEVEKKRLARERLIKFEPITPIKSGTVAYQLPETWTWVRLEDVFYTISSSQRKIKSSLVEERGDFPVVDQGQRFIAGYIDDPELVIHIPGPVVIFGDHTCELKYIDFDFVAGADGVRVLRPIGIFERFFFLVLRTFKFDDRGYSRHYKFLVNNLFPIAPLNEQRRIVAKVDQLMRLCDELEEKQKKRHEARISLNTSALDHLLAAKDPKEFDTHWQRINTNFDLLYDNPETVGKLRQAILQLAVQGTLVPQDPNDEPADKKELSAKEAPRTQAKGRTGADLGEITDADVSVEIPTSWVWARLFRLCAPDTPIVYGILQPGPDVRPGGVPYVRPTEIKGGKILLDDVRHTIDEIAAQYTRSRVKTGDILLTIVGTLGATAVIPPELDGGNITQSSCRIRPNKRLVDPAFLVRCLQSPLLVRQYEGFSLGSAVRRLNIAHVRALMIPLPPLAEQRRIVIKVNQLMTMCDELETNLTHAEKASEELVEAVVRGVEND